MTDFKLNSNHDLDLSSGGPEFVEDVDQIAQTLRITLRLIAGEWPFDTTRGVPYFERMLVSGVNDQDVKQIINDAILSVPGITAIKELNLVVDTLKRKMTINGVALADLEQIPFTTA